ncbi:MULTISPECIES: MFS transporter [Ramlibacter]|uniref:MFS transporter n=1 Tax=Ramlibacter pinisoli TaxID=2682844 RepID=A0A6N8IYC1_9BURK|nr:MULTISPECIES: MFS transporter [Ramlibacter]MBA2961836.1 MFS transporter [Ramlibacter sp. CGMCC 1.13660]MVQ31778.1 MFS transporter [Ramlibacter pinisoli]
MAASLLGISVSVIDGSIVNLALPDITRDLGASASASVWVVTAYQLAILGLLLPFASLGERLGYRRVYLWGLGLFTVSSLGCIAAVNLPMLATARAIQGIGAAGMMSVNAALVRLIYPSSMLGRGIALNSVTVATSSVAGPTVAAAVLSIASWQWLFAVNIPLGVLVLWLGRRSLPHSPPQPALGPLRLVDAGLNILMFSLVFLGADAIGARAGTERAAAPAGVGILLLAAGIVVGIFYVRRQLDQPRPLFPVDLLRIPVFALSMCTSVTAFAAQTLAFVALPFLLLESEGRSYFQAGLVITAWPLATVCLAPIAGRLIARHPGGLLGGIGLGSMALGLAALAALPAHASGLDMAWRLVLCGAGFGLFQSPNNHTIITSAPLARAGAASGMLGSARLTGQSVGAVLVGVIFGLLGVRDGRGPVVALAAAAVLAGCAAVFSTLRLRHGAARPS